MNVSHVMRRSFATIKPEAPLLEAAHLLLETNQRGLPVIDGEGTLVGIISEGDFLHRVELDIGPPPGNWLEDILGIEEDTPARRRMQARLVRDAMTRDPVCVNDETTLDESRGINGCAPCGAIASRLRCDGGWHHRSRRTAERRRTRTVPARTRCFRNICAGLVRVKAAACGEASETPGDVFFVRAAKFSS
jgi:hypothetical protein